MNIFVELADNGLSGCMLVVVVNARKWGRFGGAWCARTGPEYAGGTGPENLRKASYQQKVGRHMFSGQDGERKL